MTQIRITEIFHATPTLGLSIYRVRWEYALFPERGSQTFYAKDELDALMAFRRFANNQRMEIVG